MKKWNILIFIFFTALIFGAFYLENFIWIGQICDSRGAEPICYRKQIDSARTYHFTLESCKDALKDNNGSYVCGSGPSKSEPEATLYSSFREVYYSGNDKLETREVSFSFKLFFLASIFIFFLVFIGWIIRMALWKLKKAGSDSA